MRLRLGGRGSSLSLAQVSLVEKALESRAEVERVLVQTTGDRRSARGEPIAWKGDFTKELDEALLAGRVDLAVHSLKDVPSVLPEGLVLAAVPRREDPSDALVTRPARRFSELPSGSRVGTSSPRRRAQLLRARPDLQVLEARGNVDTRLRRLAEGKWDALVLARAGLARLGRLDEIVELFPQEILLPAPGQGALALVARRGDDPVLSAVAPMEDAGARREVLAERSLLAALEAGCRAPVAARARAEDGMVTLSAGVFSEDGARALMESGQAAAADAEALGREVAERLLARGAAELIEGMRS